MLKKWRKVILWVVILPPSLGLLYLFTLGPFLFYIGWTYDHPTPFVEVCFSPAFAVADHVPALERYYDWWWEMGSNLRH